MKKFSLIIPEPCHENWDQMTKEDKGRFCGACQKTVVDFTTMSDRQIAEFFKKPPSSVCGRFQEDQLDRDILMNRKRIPWIKYFFQFGLPAFLISMKASAQGQVRIKGDTIMQVTNKPIHSNLMQTDVYSFEGQVVDAGNIPISGSTITVMQSMEISITDYNGKFIIQTKTRDAHLAFDMV